MSEKMLIGDICDINPQGDELNTKMQVSFIPMQNVSETGKIDTSDVREFGSVAKGFAKFKEGDVLFAKITPCMENGKGALATGLVNGYGCGSTEFHVLRVKSPLVKKEWLYYYTKWSQFRKQCEKNMTGSAGQKRVSKDYLMKCKIRVPSIEEQNRANEELKLCEELIEKRKEQLRLLDEGVKSRFVEMFGKTDKKVAVSSLCDVSGGYSFKSGDISSDGSVKILQIGNVYLDDVNWETTNYLPEGFDDTYSRFLLNEGDIVIALTRPIIQSLGNVKACIVKESDTPCLLNQRVGRIVSKQNVDVSLKFIYGCLMTDDFTRYVEACCIGCSQPNISTKDIENYMIPDASYEEQMEFVKFKEQVDKSKFNIQTVLDELQSLYDSLMQQYFS